MQRPSEWPIWHDDDRRDDQGQRAHTRHEIALAGYLEKRRVDRASAVGGSDVSKSTAGAARAAIRACRRAIVLAGKGIERVDQIGMNLSKAYQEFSEPRRRG